jgi:hypothetical protein
MPAGITYTPIAKATGTGSSGTVTFSSIPSSYTDLVLVSSVLGTENAAVRLRFNGDNTNSNYSYTLMYGTGSVASSNRETATPIYIGHANTSTPNASTVTLNNYSNTTTFKTILNKGNQIGQFVSAVAGLWKSTSAINSITIVMDSGSFTTGATFNLYGILAA